jgi:hypothetical protein
LPEPSYLAKNLDFEFLVLRLFAATDVVPNAVSVTAAAAATEAVTNAAAATYAAVDGTVECEAVRVSEAANLLKIWQKFYLATAHRGQLL